ncbi:MAG: peptidase C39 family protein, partial [Ardenticatenaceae bacterium]
MTEQSIIRTATAADLDALVHMEETGFVENDRFSRDQLRYLITEANAATFVVEQAGKVRGAAIMLWRKNSTVGRLYSIVVSPKSQGRGFGGKLLQTCEDAASRRGCEYLSLEVRVDNERAIAFYNSRNYEVEETIPNFYADGANALRMVKPLEYRGTPEISLEIPYYAQTAEFTCGPACLMMAMKFLDPDFTVRRSTEFMLWKEATLIFMMGGL